DVHLRTGREVDDSIDVFERAAERAGLAHVDSANPARAVAAEVDPLQKVVAGEALPEDAADEPAGSRDEDAHPSGPVTPAAWWRASTAGLPHPGAALGARA